ncbi:MAG: cytochrome c-type biogenesis protein CcmH [Magnetococcus sp. DMHC-8]
MRTAHTVRAMLAALLWLAIPVDAAQRDEDPSEAVVRTIARELRCAVCQNQSVYESNSDLAKDMLVIIRDKVQAGETAAAIRDYFFQRYGDYIYLEPTGTGKNRILWWAPWLGLLLGLIGLWTALARWRRSPSTPDGTEPAVTAEVKHRIQKELERIEV